MPEVDDDAALATYVPWRNPDFIVKAAAWSIPFIAFAANYAYMPSYIDAGLKDKWVQLLFLAAIAWNTLGCSMLSRKSNNLPIALSFTMPVTFIAIYGPSLVQAAEALIPGMK
jgi:hypothetical protein